MWPEKRPTGRPLWNPTLAQKAAQGWGTRPFWLVLCALMTAGSTLSLLDIKWEDCVHDRGAAVHMQYLASNEAGFLHAQQYRSIADVFRRAEATHWSPAALVPVLNRALYLRRQSSQHAAFDQIWCTKDPTGTDRIHCNATSGQGDGKIAHQRVERRLGSTHAYPWLPAASAPARRVGDSDDAAAIPQQATACLGADQEGARLRIHGRLPVIERDVQRLLVKAWQIGPRVAHKNIQAAEFILDAVAHPADIVRARHIGLHGDAIGALFAYLRKRILRGLFIFIIMNGYLDALVCQL